MPAIKLFPVSILLKNNKAVSAIDPTVFLSCKTHYGSEEVMPNSAIATSLA
jgi:hypothetical protein